MGFDLTAGASKRASGGEGQALVRRGLRAVLSIACGLALLCAASPAAAQQVVALSGDGTMRVLSDPACEGSGCDWITIDNNRRSIAVAATDASLFQLHDNGAIWLWRGQPCEGASCPHWTRIDNNPRAVAIAASGSNLFQLHNDGSVWRWLGRACEGNRCPSWERLDRNPRTSAIAAAGTQLFQLHDNGEIWRWKGQPCAGERCASWERLDRNPATRQIAAAAPGNLYQRHENGSVWRWDGRPCAGDRCQSWTLLDNNPRTQRIVAAPGGLYQLHADGAIWRWLGRACEGNRCPHWERLGADRRTRTMTAGEAPFVSDLSTAPAGPAPVFQARTDGAVLRWTGAPCVGASCPGWSSVSRGDAFTTYRTDRGGLYLFAGNPAFASAPPPAAAAAGAFGYNTMRFARTGDTRVQMNVLLMLTTYSDTEFEAGQTQEFYENKYFGPRQSLENYFNKNSRDLSFEINHVGTVRVEDARPMGCAHRWATCPGDRRSYEIATVEQLETLPTDAVAGLARYDRNSDNELTSDEVFILKVEGMRDIAPPLYPFDDNGGNLRSLPRCASLAGTGKQICGTFLPIADETNLATVAHEIAHLFGARDLYGMANHSSRYTLMGGTITNEEIFFHLDPWHKMRMGMVTPRILPIPRGSTSRQSLRLTLPVNNAAYEPVLFYDPARGTNEFFMVEFRRSRASSWDYSVPSSGLVIWYVKTDGSFVPVDLRTINPSFNEGEAVIVVGAPDQRLGSGRAWRSSDGDIALRWPGGGDTGLRLRVGAFEPTASFLTLDWWTQ